MPKTVRHGVLDRQGVSEMDKVSTLLTASAYAPTRVCSTPTLTAESGTNALAVFYNALQRGTLSTLSAVPGAEHLRVGFPNRLVCGSRSINPTVTA